jgi:hypothetical protein
VSSGLPHGARWQLHPISQLSNEKQKKTCEANKIRKTSKPFVCVLWFTKKSSGSSLFRRWRSSSQLDHFGKRPASILIFLLVPFGAAIENFIFFAMISLTENLI